MAYPENERELKKLSDYLGHYWYGLTLTRSKEQKEFLRKEWMVKKQKAKTLFPKIYTIVFFFIMGHHHFWGNNKETF